MLSNDGHAELGLLKGSVEFVSYRSAWRSVFLEEHKRLSEIVGSDKYHFEHIGSTSVPGLLAKPILDIAVLVTDRKLMRPFKSALISIGYIYRGDNGQDGGHVFGFDKSPKIRTIHLHVLFCGDLQWLAYLHFRDSLRADDGIRDEYARLKVSLANAPPCDRGAYTAGKNDFIQRVLADFDE